MENKNNNLSSEVSRETSQETETNQKPTTYQQSGVDIEQADRLVSYIKRLAPLTHRPEVLGGIGGFGGLFEIPVHKYKRPVLVSGTDGVGTKLKLAIEMDKYDTIGIDLVAMCANDIITLGAEPLFFLDYFATGHLDLTQAQNILKGIGFGCDQARMALLGGETAEMPGLYHQKDYDLAGFCVGIVEKSKIIDGTLVKPGDILLGIASSGPHSNGYSLIRHIIEKKKIPLNTPFNDSTLGEVLLTPTRIYVETVLSLIETADIHAIAHITGGGLLENIPRVLPEHTQAVIEQPSWQWPEIFNWIQKEGNVTEEEMYRTFNVGVGMVVCINPSFIDEALNILTASGEKAWIIGYVDSCSEAKPKVVIS